MVLQYQQRIPTSISSEIENGLDFILLHLEEPLFLRKISTHKSNNKQFLVRTREEVIDAFTASSFVDCQINAYPYLTEYKGIQRYKPNFLFIDIDRNNFDTERKFQNALSSTLRNIKEKLEGAVPTILFTGGGYHIYQPVDIPTALENITEFQEFDRPSELLLRFAKYYFSNNKADKHNNPSFRSCLVRIPGSYRSKYDIKVKIVKKWNGIRAPITVDFLEEFRTWLIQNKIDQQKQREKLLIERSKNKNKFVGSSSNYYNWIEHLIQKPIEDFRKLVIDLILAPYLINVRKLSHSESYTIIKNWLDKCNELRKLDNYRNFVNYRIHYALNTAYKKQIPPMSFITLKKNYKDLYFLLEQKERIVEGSKKGGKD
jgi:non-catalytic primase subunit PriX-like protein